MNQRFLLLILFSVGMIIVASEIPAIPVLADIHHELELITLTLFAFFKTARFLIAVVWLRRRRCHAFYRLIAAILGVVVWMLGMMLNEKSLEFLGLVILTLSHCTECVLHACEEVRRDLDFAQSATAAEVLDGSERPTILTNADNGIASSRVAPVGCFEPTAHSQVLISRQPSLLE